MDDLETLELNGYLEVRKQMVFVGYPWHHVGIWGCQTILSRWSTTGRVVQVKRQMLADQEINVICVGIPQGSVHGSWVLRIQRFNSSFIFEDTILRCFIWVSAASMGHQQRGIAETVHLTRLNNCICPYANASIHQRSEENSTNKSGLQRQWLRAAQQQRSNRWRLGTLHTLVALLVTDVTDRWKLSLFWWPPRNDGERQLLILDADRMMASQNQGTPKSSIVNNFE